jgi:hypothetical protein
MHFRGKLGTRSQKNVEFLKNDPQKNHDAYFLLGVLHEQAPEKNVEFLKKGDQNQTPPMEAYPALERAKVGTGINSK